MNQRERVVIYPFDNKMLPIIRHSGLFEQYEFIGLVTPSGWGYNINKLSFEHKLEIHNQLDYFLNNCDTVLFSDSYIQLDFEKDIYPNMLKCVKMKKNIICLINIDKEYENEIKTLCNLNGIAYKNYFENDREIMYDFINESLLKINTPVIFVLGSTQKVQKFEIQLTLREMFINKGYKVSQIGSRRYCSLVGFHSFPAFMYDQSIGESDKIISFNRVVAQIEKEEKPDIIIIGIPGGVMKLNDTLTNKFGIFAYEVSQAVSPDLVVFSTFYQDFKPEYFKMINYLLKYRFGYEADYFNISTTQFDWDNSFQCREEVFLTTLPDFIDKKIINYKSQDIPLFNIFNKRDTDNTFKHIIEKLEDYGEIEII